MSLQVVLGLIRGILEGGGRGMGGDFVPAGVVFSQMFFGVVCGGDLRGGCRRGGGQLVVFCSFCLLEGGDLRWDG